MDLGKKVNLGNVSMEAAVERVTAALATQGFGILTKIDVTTTFKKRIDADFRPYLILGACNPHLAKRALEAVPEVGLLLPCNVVVEQVEGETHVSIADPIGLMAFLDHPELKVVGEEAGEKIDRVLAALA